MHFPSSIGAPNRRPPALSVVSAAACALLSLPAWAANRCTDAAGKVTYQDTACPNVATTGQVDISDTLGTKPSRAAARTGRGSAPVANEYAIAQGSWRGPVQFQFTVGGVRDAAAQVVTPMVLEVKGTGEVVGTVPDSGCKLSGLATQFVTPNMVSVDVSLKDCRDARFSLRYSGYLTSITSAKEAKLSLNSIAMQFPDRKIQQASLEAVLRR